MPDEEAADYNKLKIALLKRYQLTDEGFKSRFRAAKPYTGETPMQFITRLQSYLFRWVELSETSKTFEGLVELFLKEQYLSVCPRDLNLFLRERGNVRLTEMARLAEQFLVAHRQPTLSEFKQSSSNKTQDIPKDQEISAIPFSKQAAGKERNSQRGCFICGKPNHIARNCYQRPKAAAMNQEIVNGEQRFLSTSERRHVHTQGNKK